MSGYNPLAFSQTLAFLSQAASGDGKTVKVTAAAAVKDPDADPAAAASATATDSDDKGTRTRYSVYLAWILLRFALMVDLCLVSLDLSSVDGSSKL